MFTPCFSRVKLLTPGLDARAICDRLRENAVLLCWEKPGKPPCHQYTVPAWFLDRLGVSVPERTEAPSQRPLFAQT
jgi:hypothetical protein